MKRLFKAGLSIIFALLLFVIPASAATKTAYPSMTKLMVNGKISEVGAYNINGYNYYKLRDTAMLLKDTEKSFSVGYDHSSKKVLINKKEAYTTSGDVIDSTLDLSKGISATESNVSILCDNAEVSGLSVYNINGYNYFKLRDVAKMIDVGVGYDEETKIIMLMPSSSYVSIHDTKLPLYNVGCFNLSNTNCGIYFGADAETKSVIKAVEILGVTISENNSKMEAFEFKGVSEEELAKVSENLKVDAIDGLYVDYPFKLGSFVEIRVYVKLSDNGGNTENHCYILTGDINSYWDMYPNN